MIIIVYYNKLYLNQVNMVSVVSQGNSSNLKPTKYEVCISKVNSKLVYWFSEKVLLCSTLINNS